MPYNTRRKSVSLSLLGIHIPNSSRSTSHRSPPATVTTTPLLDNNTQPPPTKKLKRSDSSSSAAPQSPAISSPKALSSPKIKHDRLPSSSRIAETTPPPSPGDQSISKVDTEGIKDDIVVGVIEQLEKTGNRPHLLKELAAVLQHTLPIVENSANQPAIISSRLTTYMKRPWTALAPCPLGKELVGTHPKRIYFFLTTQPRQPFPETPDILASQHRIISPSLTSGETEEDDQPSRRRSAMSPSPEVDLSTPELDDEHSPMSSSASFSNPDTQPSTFSSRRGKSPPLEGMEREFTQMAFTLQSRQLSEALKREAELGAGEAEYVKVERNGDNEDGEDAVMLELDLDETEESAALRNKEAADALFGACEDGRLGVLHGQMSMFGLTSSPVLRPLQESKTLSAFDVIDVWKNPETVELEELDDLFEAY